MPFVQDNIIIATLTLQSRPSFLRQTITDLSVEPETNSFSSSEIKHRT